MTSMIEIARERRFVMSLDIASHPGRTGTDELVPSRYALRVGKIDVLMISDGVFPLAATTLATNADPADLSAWLDDRLQPPDVYKWPLNVVVVRSGGRTVLIDSGAGSEFPDFPQVRQLATRLDAAGFGRLKSGSSTCTAASCGRSGRSTRWRR